MASGEEEYSNVDPKIEAIFRALIAGNIDDFSHNGMSLFETVCHEGTSYLLSVVLGASRISPMLEQHQEKGIKIFCEQINVECLTLLLRDERIDINCTNTGNNSPLATLIENSDRERERSLECFKLIFNHPKFNLDAHKDVDDGWGTILHLACKCGALDILKILLQDGRLDPNEQCDEGNALHVSEVVPVIEELLKDGRADPSVEREGKTGFYEAIFLNDKELVQLFLKDPRVDPNVLCELGWNAFNCISSDLSWELIEVLLKDGRADVNRGDPTEFGKTILHVVVHHGQHEHIQELVEHPTVDLNAQDDFGRTALYMARWKEDKRAEEILLLSGRIIEPDSPKHTPERGVNRTDIIHDANFDVYELDVFNESLSERAVKYCDEEIICSLLSDPRFDVNRQEGSELPLLLTACDLGNLEIVKLLLKDKRFDLNLKINEPQGRYQISPAHLACQNFSAQWKNTQEILRIFLDREDVKLDHLVAKGIMLAEDPVDVGVFICSHKLISPSELMKDYQFSDNEEEQEMEQACIAYFIQTTEKKLRLLRSRSARKAPIPKRRCL